MRSSRVALKKPIYCVEYPSNQAAIYVSGVIIDKKITKYATEEEGKEDISAGAREHVQFHNKEIEWAKGRFAEAGFRPS